MLREWVVEGGGLDGYFGEQGLPAGIQECLERFHRRCVDYLSRQFVPKWDCPNGELATARTASLLVELEGPEGPNYHLKAAKAGFRAEKRDNGGLGFHEALVKFP